MSSPHEPPLELMAERDGMDTIRGTAALVARYFGPLPEPERDAWGMTAQQRETGRIHVRAWDPDTDFTGTMLDPELDPDGAARG